MKMSRVWCMPNSKTFTIKPIKELILSYLPAEQKNTAGGFIILDPFANEHSIKSIMSNVKYITNDLDNNYNCDYSLDAYEFLSEFKENSIDLILYDPPYSPRQVKEVYTSIDKVVTKKDTQSDYWNKFKKEIKRILKVNGKCISFGWDSNGIGKGNGFKIIEILLIAHGGAHNDTICTVEVKKHYQSKFDLGDD
jgi:hypothetical protein